MHPEIIKTASAELRMQSLIDFHVTSCGDDLQLIMTHNDGVDSERIHKIAWDIFNKATEVAKRLKLYGAGQDLLRDAFSGNTRGLGPAVAEMEFEERPNEPFLMFTADKTEPGAYNLPLFLAFADPMYNSGLILSPTGGKGYRFTVIDVDHTEGDRVIELLTPEDTYDLAALLRDNGRYVIESIHSRHDGDIAVSSCTTRLRNIAGKYVGKDDPVMLVRTQKNFPATGEVLAPFEITHYVAGFMRGSHTGPLTPVKERSPVSFFDGPPIVGGLAFSIREGVLTGPVDVFDHPYWDWVRAKAAQKAHAIREQGFSGAAMLGIHDLEYVGINHRLDAMDSRFVVRNSEE